VGKTRGMAAAPPVLDALLGRFDPSVFDAPSGRARLRLAVDDDTWDFVVNRNRARLEPADRATRADARLSADRATWSRVGRDLRGGMNAFRGGRLRRWATSRSRGPARRTRRRS
jgi:hypothetical protein